MINKISKNQLILLAKEHQKDYGLKLPLFSKWTINNRLEKYNIKYTRGKVGNNPPYEIDTLSVIKHMRIKIEEFNNYLSNITK